MSSENLLRVLTIFDASEEAEALINILRNAGHIVRNIRVEDEEDMLVALEENPIDVILVKNKMPYFTAKQAAQALTKTGRDIPMIVITLPGKETAAADALAAGARDAIAEDQTARLKHAVKREVSDLSERRAHRRCEHMLRETEKRAKDLIDHSRDAISYVHDGMHIYANNAYLKMFGYEDLEDVQGMPIMDMVSGEDHAKLKEFLRGYAKGESMESRLAVHGQHTEGKKFKIEMEFSPASMEGESCTQIIIRDQSISKELEQKLNVMSQQDLLTGLYNRNFFLEHLDQVINHAVEGNVRGALYYISLDKYQDIRTEMGIGASDHLLINIAKLLKEKIGDKGMLARFEGPVFTFILQNIDHKKAEAFGASLCKLVNEHLTEIEGKTVSTSISIGITLLNETSTNAQDCISRAEKGALIAHKEGGNACHTYNPAIEDLAEHEKVGAWTGKIKEALKDNKFRLMFQPIVSLHGEPGAHYEVLLRMIDDDGSELSPADFMPVAEKTGLTNFVDRWVIANAFMMLSKKGNEASKTRLFIKLTNGSLTDPEFLPWVRDRLTAMKINADNIVFQISEDTALNYLNQAKNVVAGLSQLSFRTAIENFGMEQNTFQSLKNLPVNYIKFHMKLIQALSQNVENQEKVKSIAEAVAKQNIQAIATYVEDANVLAVLWQCAVDFIQGHFLQEPLPDMTYDFEESG